MAVEGDRIFAAGISPTISTPPQNLWYQGPQEESMIYAAGEIEPNPYSAITPEELQKLLEETYYPIGLEPKKQYKYTVKPGPKPKEKLGKDYYYEPNLSDAFFKKIFDDPKEADFFANLFSDPQSPMGSRLLGEIGDPIRQLNNQINTIRNTYGLIETRAKEQNEYWDSEVTKARQAIWEANKTIENISNEIIGNQKINYQKALYQLIPAQVYKDTMRKDLPALELRERTPEFYRNSGIPQIMQRLGENINTQIQTTEFQSMPNRYQEFTKKKGHTFFDDVVEWFKDVVHDGIPIYIPGTPGIYFAVGWNSKTHKPTFKIGAGIPGETFGANVTVGDDMKPKWGIDIPITKAKVGKFAVPISADIGWTGSFHEPTISASAKLVPGDWIGKKFYPKIETSKALGMSLNWSERNFGVGISKNGKSLYLTKPDGKKPEVTLKYKTDKNEFYVRIDTEKGEPIFGVGTRLKNKQTGKWENLDLELGVEIGKETLPRIILSGEFRGKTKFEEGKEIKPLYGKAKIAWDPTKGNWFVDVDTGSEFLKYLPGVQIEKVKGKEPKITWDIEGAAKRIGQSLGEEAKKAVFKVIAGGVKKVPEDIQEWLVKASPDLSKAMKSSEIIKNMVSDVMKPTPSSVGNRLMNDFYYVKEQLPIKYDKDSFINDLLNTPDYFKGLKISAEKAKGPAKKFLLGEVNYEDMMAEFGEPIELLKEKVLERRGEKEIKEVFGKLPTQDEARRFIKSILRGEYPLTISTIHKYAPEDTKKKKAEYEKQIKHFMEETGTIIENARKDAMQLKDSGVQFAKFIKDGLELAFTDDPLIRKAIDEAMDDPEAWKEFASNAFNFGKFMASGMWQDFKNIVTHPYQTFKEHPVYTLMNASMYLKGAGGLLTHSGKFMSQTAAKSAAFKSVNTAGKFMTRTGTAIDPINILGNVAKPALKQAAKIPPIRNIEDALLSRIEINSFLQESQLANTALKYGELQEQLGVLRSIPNLSATELALASKVLRGTASKAELAGTAIRPEVNQALSKLWYVGDEFRYSLLENGLFTGKELRQRILNPTFEKQLAQLKAGKLVKELPEPPANFLNWNVYDQKQWISDNYIIFGPTYSPTYVPWLGETKSILFDYLPTEQIKKVLPYVGTKLEKQLELLKMDPKFALQRASEFQYQYGVASGMIDDVSKSTMAVPFKIGDELKKGYVLIDPEGFKNFGRTQLRLLDEYTNQMLKSEGAVSGSLNQAFKKIFPTTDDIAKQGLLDFNLNRPIYQIPKYLAGQLEQKIAPYTNVWKDWAKLIYQAPMDVWTMSVLATRPFWYGANATGNLTYTTLAKTPLDAYAKAFQQKYKVLMPDQVLDSGFSAEYMTYNALPQITRTLPGRILEEWQKTKLLRTRSQLMELNSKIEEYFRSAAYIGKAENQLKQEILHGLGTDYISLADELADLYNWTADDITRAQNAIIKASKLPKNLQTQLNIVAKPSTSPRDFLRRLEEAVTPARSDLYNAKAIAKAEMKRIADELKTVGYDRLDDFYRDYALTARAPSEMIAKTEGTNLLNRLEYLKNNPNDPRAIEAIEHVDRFLNNYNKIAPILNDQEKRLLTSIVPFWKFYTHSAYLLGYTALEQPQTYVMIQKLDQARRTLRDERIEPERTRAAIEIAKDFWFDPQYLNPFNLVLSGGKEGFGGLNIFNPIFIRAPIEQHEQAKLLKALPDSPYFREKIGNTVWIRTVRPAHQELFWAVYRLGGLKKEDFSDEEWNSFSDIFKDTSELFDPELSAGEMINMLKRGVKEGWLFLPPTDVPDSIEDLAKLLKSASPELIGVNLKTGEMKFGDYSKTFLERELENIPQLKQFKNLVSNFLPKDYVQAFYPDVEFDEKGNPKRTPGEWLSILRLFVSGVFEADEEEELKKERTKDKTLISVTFDQFLRDHPEVMPEIYDDMMAGRFILPPAHEFDMFNYEIDKNIERLMPESERYLSREEQERSLRAMRDQEIEEIKDAYQELYDTTQYLNPTLRTLMRAEGRRQRDEKIEELEKLYDEKISLAGLEDIFEEERKITEFRDELRYLDDEIKSRMNEELLKLPEFKDISPKTLSQAIEGALLKTKGALLDFPKELANMLLHPEITSEKLRSFVEDFFLDPVKSGIKAREELETLEEKKKYIEDELKALARRELKKQLASPWTQPDLEDVSEKELEDLRIMRSRLLEDVKTLDWQAELDKLDKKYIKAFEELAAEEERALNLIPWDAIDAKMNKLSKQHEYQRRRNALNTQRKRELTELKKKAKAQMDALKKATEERYHKELRFVIGESIDKWRRYFDPEAIPSGEEPSLTTALLGIAGTLNEINSKIGAYKYNQFRKEIGRDYEAFGDELYRTLNESAKLEKDLTKKLLYYKERYPGSVTGWTNEDIIFLAERNKTIRQFLDKFKGTQNRPTDLALRELLDLQNKIMSRPDIPMPSISFTEEHVPKLSYAPASTSLSNELNTAIQNIRKLSSLYRAQPEALTVTGELEGLKDITQGFQEYRAQRGRSVGFYLAK